MMFARIGTVHNKGERMMMEDLKNVEGIEGVPQLMQDVSPSKKSIPYLEAHTLRENLEMPNESKGGKLQISDRYPIKL